MVQTEKKKTSCFIYIKWKINANYLNWNETFREYVNKL